MYKSPIKINYTELPMEITKTLDGEIIAQVREKISIDVDAEEMKKALRYDRAQYEKGFNDAVNSVVNSNEYISVKWLRDLHNRPDIQSSPLMLRAIEIVLDQLAYKGEKE